MLVGTSRKVLNDVDQNLLNIFRTDHTNKIKKFKNFKTLYSQFPLSVLQKGDKFEFSFFKVHEFEFKN